MWGFRFRRRGGLPSPLAAYEDAFAGIENEREVCRRRGDTVALRFEDPLQRRDRSGRIIPHEFVLFGRLADEVHSIEDGLRIVWPLVADEYARDWPLAEPHSGEEISES